MVEVSVALDSSTVPASGGALTATVTIQPGVEETAAERHLALCVDTSGSMAGEKIEQVREGIRWVFGYLDGEDTVSIVAFSDVVEVVLPATRWDDLDREAVDAAVDRLTANGGTDILGGLEAAHETLRDLPTGPDIARRILLLSDGRDETPVETFVDLARRLRREEDIAIPAAGIGDFYDEEVVRGIGTASAGEWVHLSRPADIEDFFGRKVNSLQTVVAPNPNIEFELTDGVEIDEVLLRRPQVRDVQTERRGRTVRVYLPDLVELEAQELTLRLETPPCPDGETVRLAAVRLNTRTGNPTTAIEADCSAGVGDRETRVEAPEVSLAHVDTVIRKATSEGDVETAETVIDRATEIHDEADVAALDTVVEDDAGGVSALDTVIEGADQNDREAKYLTTKIQDQP